MILLGDINIDTLMEDNAFKHELYIYNVEDLVHEPTCFKWPEDTLIDHIIVKSPRWFKKLMNVFFYGKSDIHNLVGCLTKIQLHCQKPFQVIYRPYKNFDVSQIPFISVLYLWT